MGEPLKNHFGPEIPKTIAGMISRVFPDFASESFLEDALEGYDALALTPRGWQIARALQCHLPIDYEAATEILIHSLGPELDRTENLGMAPFLYLPHVFFVSEFGVDHFDISMEAQYELTKRFTAEFSIRSFLVRYPDQTIERLKAWTGDSNVHVRRLVSEGTRPRLPWAPRLPDFQDDPRPVLDLLERLKDDPELYVRRSVANNLNDIGKDNPGRLIEIVRRWAKNASAERSWLIRHALRSEIKRGDPLALDILGYGDPANVAIQNEALTPSDAYIGNSVNVSFVIVNKNSFQKSLLVDLRVHFVKANGDTRPKVFKLKAFKLEPRERVRLHKSISLKQMTTRKHYPGVHKVEVLVNGRVDPIGEFNLKTIPK